MARESALGRPPRPGDLGLSRVARGGWGPNASVMILHVLLLPLRFVLLRTFLLLRYEFYSLGFALHSASPLRSRFLGLAHLIVYWGRSRVDRDGSTFPVAPRRRVASLTPNGCQDVSTCLAYDFCVR